MKNSTSLNEYSRKIKKLKEDIKSESIEPKIILNILEGIMSQFSSDFESDTSNNSEFKEILRTINDFKTNFLLEEKLGRIKIKIHIKPLPNPSI